MLRDRVLALRMEVNCRIEHGAESGGHLDYVQAELDRILEDFPEDDFRIRGMDLGPEDWLVCSLPDHVRTERLEEIRTELGRQFGSRIVMLGGGVSLDVLRQTGAA